MILANPFRRKPDHAAPQQIYGAVMAQARRSAFFRDFAIADTVTGRLDMLCLHMVLISQRLAREAEPLAVPLNQEIFDEFAADLDRALRQIGIGDTSVPKRKKKMVHGYYGQLHEIVPALEAEDGNELARRIEERYYAGKDSVHAPALAAYVMSAYERLREIPFDRIVATGPDWPDPAMFANARKARGE